MKTTIFKTFTLSAIVRNNELLDTNYIKTVRHFFVALIVLTAFSVPALAQEDANARKFRLAESFLRNGKLDRAANLLEDLVSADPFSFIYFDRLKSAYINLKEYDKAIAITETRRGESRDQGLFAELGSLHYQKGDFENAKRYWNEAIAISPSSPQSYRVVYYSMNANRAFEDAISLLIDGREKLSAPKEFRSDLGHLYGLVGDHGNAISEYLNLIVEQPEQIGYVKRRLSRITEQAGVLNESIPPVQKAIQDNPLNRQVRELAAWLYFEGGLYEQAFKTNQAIDILEKENGRTLYVFAKNAMSAEAYPVALKAFQKVLELYPDAPAAANSRFATAQLYIKEGRGKDESGYDSRGNRIAAQNFDMARSVLLEFLQKHSKDGRAPDALFELAKLESDVYFRLGESESMLKEIQSKYPGHPAADLSAFQLGSIALMKDDLVTARLEFSRLEKNLRTGELAESARFQIAMIDFYSGQFESATILTKAVDTNTSTDMANDAIELKILLQENRGPDSLDTALVHFARASLLQRQRSFDAANALLRQIEKEFPEHALEDEVHYKRAEIARAKGDLQNAIDLFSSIPELYPKSYLCDVSLKNVGEILEKDLGDIDAAMAIYSSILDKYPGSLLAPDLRDRIRKLRGTGA